MAKSTTISIHENWHQGNGLKYHSITDVLITEKNNNISGRVASRYYHVYGSENFQEGHVIGTPSQVDKFFKKYNASFTCASRDQSAIDQAICKYKKKRFEAEKEEFLKELKGLLVKHNFDLVLACHGGGWGEAWGSADLTIKDKITGVEEALLEADDFDEEDKLAVLE